MELDLAAVLALAASGDYAVNAALSDESAALILSAAVDLANPENWIGEGYILTDDETDTIFNMVATMLEEVMVAGWEPGNGEGMAIAILRDEKASGVDGGTFTSGGWRHRTLNTVQSDIDDIATLAANEFALGAGTYLLLALTPAYRVAGHQARIYNVSDTSEEFVGESLDANVANAVANSAMVFGILVLAATKTLRIEHRCVTTFAGEGMGRAAAFGVEVYTELLIVKAE